MALSSRADAHCCRANMAHMRQSRPNYGLEFQIFKSQIFDSVNKKAPVEGGARLGFGLLLARCCSLLALPLRFLQRRELQEYFGVSVLRIWGLKEIRFWAACSLLANRSWAARSLSRFDFSRVASCNGGLKVCGFRLGKSLLVNRFWAAPVRSPASLSPESRAAMGFWRFGDSG